jgi:hypothetical protein
LLIGREDLVKDNKVEDSEDGIEITDCADFFLINYIDRGADGFAENSEDDIDIADCENFFFANYIGRGAEDFAGNGEIENDEDSVGIADCEKFFVNYADRCAVSLHSANLVIIIAAVKTANIYRS